MQGPKLSLKDFMRRSQVLHTYRQLLKVCLNVLCLHSASHTRNIMRNSYIFCSAAAQEVCQAEAQIRAACSLIVAVR